MTIGQLVFLTALGTLTWVVLIGLVILATVLVG
jgi:hypothetical protein